MPTFSIRRSQKRSAPSSFSRNRRVRRRFTVESLESRTLLSYTFTYDPANHVATAQGTAAVDSLVISPIGGLLEHSVNGGAFSSVWGTLEGPTVPAANTVTVDVTLSSGDGSSLQLGGNSGLNVGGPASALAATFILTMPTNTTDTVVIDDSTSTAASLYMVDAGTNPNFPITGPGIKFQEPSGIANGGITLKGSSGADTYNVLSTYSSSIGSEPVTIDGGASSGNVVNVGSNPTTPASSTLGDIFALLTVNDAAGKTTLNLLDAGDTNSGAGTITRGTVSGLDFGAGGSVAYTGGATTGVTSLNVHGGTSGASGITYFVSGTTAATTLNTGSNADTVNVLATGNNAPLFIHGNDGADTVNIGDEGSVLGILGDVTIDNTNDFTAINIDASNDSTDHNATLSGFNPSTLIGLAPATITYTTGETSSLTINTGPAGNQVLNIDFSSGNPIPAFSTTGLIFNAGADFGNTLNSHALNLFGTLPSGAFASEIHNANDHGVSPQIGQYGSIFFTDSLAAATGLNYTGLLPINDTTPAVDYTFNDFADDQSFTAQNGPTVLGFDTIQFVNTPAVQPPTFETTNVANKTNIVFNTTTTAGVNGIVNITTPSTGLASLAFNMSPNNDVVNLNALPGGIAFLLNSGGGTDVVNVLSAAPGSTIDIDGGASTLFVNIGSAGSVQGIQSEIHVHGSPNSTFLHIDDSADSIAANATLTASGPNSLLTGLAPATISYATLGLTQLFVTSGVGNDTMTVDFSGGSPLGTSVVLFYDGGSGSNLLKLIGGPGVTTEAHSATGPGQGSIFLDGGVIQYSHLAPVYDLVPATNYVFNMPTGTQTINIADGPVFGGAQTIQIASAAVPPAFELVNFANKTNVQINDQGGTYTLNVDVPTAAAGLKNWQINPGPNNDVVNLNALPGGIAFALNAGSGDDTVNVNVLKLDPTSTYNLDGGPGIDTLNVESGGNEVIGTTTTITYGALVLNYAGFEIVNALTFTVTNTNNAGIGSLRYAMQNADAVPTLKTVKFRILHGTAPFTIQPLSPLPIISQPTIIDGTTQPGYSGVPLISLTPSTADPFTGDGLTLLGGGNTVQGLDIGGFNGNGIRITRGGGNVIQNNRIGTDPAGTTERPNSGSGILIEASSNNKILDNLVSGNGAAGITLTDTAAPLVLSDTLSGTVSGSLSGTVSGSFGDFFSPGMLSGSYVLQGLLQGAFFNLNVPNAPGQLGTTSTPNYPASPTFTGSTTLGPWSATLSGQGLSQTLNAPASRPAPTTITIPSQGSIIETFTLSGALGGFPYTFLGTFNGTVSGTTVTGPVSGPMTVAVQETLLSVTSAPKGNLISGNKIGTDVSGGAALGNVFDGILLSNASGTSISGNQISGNGVGQDAAGINVTGVNSSGNVMSNNLIGTNAAGTADLGNSLHGIFVGNGASNNTVGPGNVISGNGMPTNQGVGVYVFGSTTTGNRITGNRIGTNATGTAGLTDSAGLIHPVIGVLISQSSGNTVQGNLISGNRFLGLEIAGVAGGTASGNLVQGNLIGTNAGGTRAIPNGFDGIFINDAPNNMIGGTAAGAGNLISGNGSVGIQLFGPLTLGNVIQGNALGLDSAGRPTLRNPAGGIFVNTGPLNNTIGGTAPGQANRGQSRPLFTVSGSQQSNPGSTAQAATAAGRRFRVPGRARISLRAHSTAH